jgi:1,4-dihydroxy-6-naphthoate synthase
MNLTLGFSPCPNDTFIFDALVNNKIDTQGFSFNVVLEDVETLNQLAINDSLDVTKISYGVYPLIMKNYMILNSGSALGNGVGPLLVAKNNVSLKEVENYKIAIPGEHTTAHMLFNLAFPNVANKVFLRYDEIENFVLQSGPGTAGVIIHESRFTYQEKGLVKVVDLGKFWEEETGFAIPVGGIVAKKNIDPFVLKKIDELIKESIEYGFKNYPALSDYIKSNSQEMSEEVMRKHIELYVNDYSISLGKEGKNAIQKLLDTFQKNKRQNDHETAQFLEITN